MRGSDPVQARRMVLVTGHYDSRNSNDLDRAQPRTGSQRRWLRRGRLPGMRPRPQQVTSPCDRGLCGRGRRRTGPLRLRPPRQTRQIEGWQLEAVLNNDIVGGNSTTGDTLQLKDRVRVFSEGVPAAATPGNSAAFAPSARKTTRPAANWPAASPTPPAPTSLRSPAVPFTPFLVSRPDRYLRGGDHSSFNREGFAAVRFTEWREDFNHQHQNVVLPPPAPTTPATRSRATSSSSSTSTMSPMSPASTPPPWPRWPPRPGHRSSDHGDEKLENGSTLDLGSARRAPGPTCTTSCCGAKPPPLTGSSPKPSPIQRVPRLAAMPSMFPFPRTT